MQGGSHGCRPWSAVVERPPASDAVSHPPDPRSPDTCRHHWRLPPPNGPTVQGVCRRCGAEREFPTTTETSLWETADERRLRRGEGDHALDP